MKHIAIALLVSMASLAAHAGTTPPSAPLCTETTPTCVVPNWGQIEPDGVDSLAPSTTGDKIGGSGHNMSVKLMPAAASDATLAPKTDAPLKTLVSPVNLFPKETAALTAAIGKARFNPDGSIVSGQAQIASAAAAAAKKAGKKYALTLYIKVPPTLKPDRAEALGRKVQSINDLLANPSARTGKSAS